MAGKKWTSPMLRGRGLRTINALPPLPALTRGPWGRGEATLKPQAKALQGPQWHVPGYAQLAVLHFRRR
jgi:hypothetical protein